jgi:hypothetical protein
VIFPSARVADQVIEVHLRPVLAEISELPTDVSTELTRTVLHTLRHTQPVVQSIGSTERSLVDALRIHLDLMITGR